MKKLLTIKSLTSGFTTRIFFTTILVTCLSNSIFADDSNVVKNLLQKKFDDMITVLKSRNLGEEVKKGKIEDTIKPLFDFSLMSKLALGRSSWTAMEKEDQEKFVELFTKVFKDAYLSKILDYVDEDIIFGECNQDGKKVLISSFIVGENKKIPVLYKFYQSDPGWKIYDIEIEGVSYIQTYRSQFTESLKEMTVRELMVKMENLISSQ